MRDFWRAVKFASVKKKLMFLALFASLASAIIEALSPQIIRLIINLIEESVKGITIPNRNSLLFFYIFLYGLAIFSDEIFSHLQNYLTPKWWNETRLALSSAVFSHLETLSLNYFEKNTSGKIKERVDRGINDMNNIIEGALLDILPQTLYILIAIYFLFRVNAIFGFIVFLGVPLFILFSSFFTKKLIAYQDQVRDSDEKASSIAMETILNIRTVKSFSSEDRHYKKLTSQLRETVKHSMNYIKTRIVMNVLRFITVNLAQLIILGIGAYWALIGKISIGDFTIAWMYTNRSFGPLWYLTRLFDNMQRDMRSVRRVFELMDTTPDITDKNGAKTLKVTRGDIEFKDISFSYEGKDVFKDIDLKVPQGQVIALVGKSGVGKSTLVKLLLRFYDPQKGSISINDIDIRDVTQKSLRENIGVVMQDSALFNDTAFNNILYGNPKAKKAEVIKAAKMANAHEFISKLPDGYETIVGEKGVKLSGGEQQRINIARAILKNPPILVLDEATSSLDSQSEKLIQDALWQLIKGRTTIIIAHRLSTIMRADQIVVFDKGRIVEMDTHQNLVKNDGIYSKLFKIQSGGYLK